MRWEGMEGKVGMERLGMEGNRGSVNAHVLPIPIGFNAACVWTPDPPI